MGGMLEDADKRAEELRKETSEKMKKEDEKQQEKEDKSGDGPAL